MGSSLRHPCLRLGAQTGALSRTCHDFPYELPSQDTSRVMKKGRRVIWASRWARFGRISEHRSDRIRTVREREAQEISPKMVRMGPKAPPPPASRPAGNPFSAPCQCPGTEVRMESRGRYAIAHRSGRRGEGRGGARRSPSEDG